MPNEAEFNRVETLAQLLKLVGESSRLQLLCLLRQSEHCVCELLDHVEMSQSLLSHHLADLRTAGLVADRKEGRQVYYSLTDAGLHITNQLFAIKETV